MTLGHGPRYPGLYTRKRHAPAIMGSLPPHTVKKLSQLFCAMTVNKIVICPGSFAFMAAAWWDPQTGSRVDALFEGTTGMVYS